MRTKPKTAKETSKKATKPKRFGETLPLRISSAVDAKVSLIAIRHNITKSDVVRMAINHGLPDLEAGRLPAA